MILCPKCNKELSVNALFCTECGERIIPQCPNCGVMLTNEANYCPKCGALLNSCHNVKATKALINATVSPQEILLGIEDISETSEVEKNKSNTKNEWFFIKYWRGKRPSHRLCKPPERCKIESTDQEVLLWREEIVIRNVKQSGKR